MTQRFYSEESGLLFSPLIISANHIAREISEIFLLISLKIVTRPTESVDLPPQITHTLEL